MPSFPNWLLHRTGLSGNNLLYSAGNGTHPQIILDEVSFVLRGLGKLVLHSLTAMHINLPLRRSESRTELNLHEQESRTSSSSFQNVKLQSILSSERAHLFLLYRNMCELLATRYTPSKPQASSLCSRLSITLVYSNIRNVEWQGTGSERTPSSTAHACWYRAGLVVG